MQSSCTTNKGKIKDKKIQLLFPDYKYNINIMHAARGINLSGSILKKLHICELPAWIVENVMQVSGREFHI